MLQARNIGKPKIELLGIVLLAQIPKLLSNSSILQIVNRNSPHTGKGTIFLMGPITWPLFSRLPQASPRVSLADRASAYGLRTPHRIHRWPAGAACRSERRLYCSCLRRIPLLVNITTLAGPPPQSPPGWPCRTPRNRSAALPCTDAFDRLRIARPVSTGLYWRPLRHARRHLLERRFQSEFLEVMKRSNEVRKTELAANEEKSSGERLKPLALA